MSMKRSPLKRIRTAIILLCLALIVGIIAYAFFSQNNNTVLEKEKIESNLEKYSGQDFGYDYISSYIEKYGIGNLNNYKLNYIESRLEKDFYKDLPAEYEIAKTACELYLQYFYDNVDNNDSDAVTDAIIHCLFAATGDKYAYYRNPDEFQEYLSSLQGGSSFVGIGVMVDLATLKVNMVYRGSGAEEAGIKRGDIIYAVEGTTVSDVVTTEQLTTMLRGEVNTSVNVTIKRGDKLIDMVVVRKALTEQSVSYELDSDKVGYIYITQFLGSTVNEFKEAVDFCTNNGAVALVIDVRGNPGGLLESVVNIIDYLIPDAENRMIATYNQGNKKYVFNTEDGHGVNIPIAVVCNGGTASAGELFTAAMRDFNNQNVIDAIVVGSTTYGKGVIQTSYSIYDGSGITYTVGYYNPPCDVNFDGIGITPDFQVEDVSIEDVPFNTAKEEILNIVYKNGKTSAFLPAA